MKKMTWKFAVLLPALFLLASCSDNKKIVDLNLRYLSAHTVPMEATDQQAQAQIAEASIAVGKSLQQLAAIQMTVHPPKHLRRPFNPSTIGMSKTASIDWVGPVEPVLKKIAQATHYHLRVVGHKPSLPVIVSLNAQNRPIADILRNIMYQVILKADIAVYAKSRTIELRYHGN